MRIKDYFELSIFYIKGNLKQIINTSLIIIASLFILISSICSIFIVKYGIEESISDIPYSKSVYNYYYNNDDMVTIPEYDNTEYMTYYISSIPFYFNYNEDPICKDRGDKKDIKREGKLYIGNDEHIINVEKFKEVCRGNTSFNITFYNKELSNTLFSRETENFVKKYDYGNVLLSGTSDLNTKEVLVSDLFCDLLNINYNSIVGKTISYSSLIYQYDDKNFYANDNYIFKDFLVKGVYNHMNCEFDSYVTHVLIGSGHMPMMIFLSTDKKSMENINDYDDNKVNIITHDNRELHTVLAVTNQIIHHETLESAINNINDIRQYNSINIDNYIEGYMCSDLYNVIYSYSKSISTLKSVSAILLLVSITIFISSIFGITNVIVYNLRKRNTYVGIQKAIGFTSKDISKIYILEQMITSSIISIISTVISLIPITIIFILENNFIHRYSDFISLSPKYIIFSILIVVGMYLFITFIISNIIIKFNVKKKITDQLARE